MWYGTCAGLTMQVITVGPSVVWCGTCAGLTMQVITVGPSVVWCGTCAGFTMQVISERERTMERSITLADVSNSSKCFHSCRGWGRKGLGGSFVFQSNS